MITIRKIVAIIGILGCSAIAIILMLKGNMIGGGIWLGVAILWDISDNTSG